MDPEWLRRDIDAVIDRVEVNGIARGILDTSTVVLLERMVDLLSRPPEMLITAITLAELSVVPSSLRHQVSEPPVSCACSRPGLTSIRYPSMPPQREPSGLQVKSERSLASATAAVMAS